MTLKPKDRYELVKKLDHCVKCVSMPKGHCPCKVKCYYCKRGHNRFLHFHQSFPPPKKPPISQKPSLSAVIKSGHDVETFTETEF